MSGYPGSSTGNPNNENVAGVDSLLSQLRQQTRPINLDSSFHCYYNDHKDYYGQLQTQSQSSHDFLPPSAPTPPVGPSSNRNIVSHNKIDASQFRSNARSSNTDRTSSLLNLLKFSQPSSSPTNLNSQNSAPLPNPISRVDSTGYAGSDGINPIHKTQRSEDANLLAALMNSSQTKSTQQLGPQYMTTPTTQSNFGPVSKSPPADTQAYLLQLLNQPQVSSRSEASKTPHLKKETFSPISLNKQTAHCDDVKEVAQAMGEPSVDGNTLWPSDNDFTPADNKDNFKASSIAKNKSGIFTYVNPFDGLAASSPRNRVEKASEPQAHINSNVQILKNPRNETLDNKAKLNSDESNTVHNEQIPNQIPIEHAGEVSQRDEDSNLKVALTSNGSIGHMESEDQAIDTETEKINQNSKPVTSPVQQDNSNSQIEDELREMLATKNEKGSVVLRKSIVSLEKKNLEVESDAIHHESPSSTENATDKTVKAAALTHVVESWETVDAEENLEKEGKENIVKVFNFPMRPWTSILVKPAAEKLPEFRKESILDIARLKRDFESVDRTLVSASPNFIVYGMSKNGGIRVVRQDDGMDAKIFTETHDRIYNVVISTSSTEPKQTIIGTGISGTVYWLQIRDSKGDHLEDCGINNYGFALPPLQVQEPENSGTVFKTRARKSSNQPGLFAVSRGKFISIIYPSIILEKYILKDTKDRLVDVDAYLNKYSLNINTVKATKDFIFSEDDTTIVSIDKLGRVKFWDIRNLTKGDKSDSSSQPRSIEIKQPIITFNSSASNEKSGPSSILFVDKIRPYQRGGALRYFIVGTKQNHTLQLWDISLAKPVQEIHLPHSNDSDPICSIVYHAATGMIIVGHPSRNSIYFLHFSAPKYTLPRTICQADYVEKLANSDSLISKPDSTAVISGMREYSFANKGVLRSLDILQTPIPSSPGETGSLFELYCMHSKGVTCLDIHQADLGWNSENRVINPVIAENINMITIDTLKEIPTHESTESQTQPINPMRIVTRSSGLKDVENSKETNATKQILAESARPTLFKSDEKPDKKETSTSNGALSTPSAPEKFEKKKRRKGPSEPIVHGQSGNSFRMPVIDPSSNVRNISTIRNNSNSTPDVTFPAATNESDIKNVEKLLHSTLDKFFQCVRNESQMLGSSITSNHESLSRTISATLNDNIDTKLAKIVKSSIEGNVIPVISDTASKAVQEQLGAKLNAHLAEKLPRELQRCLPDTVSKCLYQPQLLKLISESLASTVAFTFQKDLTGIIANNIIPSVSNILSQTVNKIANDIQARYSEQINIIDQQRHSDSIKISQLTQLVTGLSETVSSMASAQTEFQGQLLKIHQQTANDMQNISRNNEMNIKKPVSRTSSVLNEHSEKNRANEEYDNMMISISAAMNAGDYENAVIQWLQTRREQEFFANYFSKFNPEFIRELSPLLLLSLGATISVELEGETNNESINQRIAWLEIIFATFQAHLTAGSMVR